MGVARVKMDGRCYGERGDLLVGDIVISTYRLSEARRFPRCRVSGDSLKRLNLVFFSSWGHFRFPFSLVDPGTRGRDTETSCSKARTDTLSIS